MSGSCRDALVSAEVRSRRDGEAYWSLPVVGETWDGTLNDINGMHVREEHLFRALESAAEGAVPEGNIGGGTGMVCHEFKGGIGTSSRVVEQEHDAFTVGVLVQANYGRRERLTVAGVPVGAEIPTDEVPAPGAGGPALKLVPPGAGSIIVVVATDAPLLPHQCSRLAQRAGLGIARVGGVGGHSSGDLFIAFATGNAGTKAAVAEGAPPLTSAVTMLSDAFISPLFEAVVDATEEAILNALVAAETMTGRDGITAYALPHDRLAAAMARYGRAGTAP